MWRQALHCSKCHFQDNRTLKNRDRTSSCFQRMCQLVSDDHQQHGPHNGGDAETLPSLPDLYWIVLQVRSQMQQVLLDRTAHEPIHSVRRGLADVIAATARQSVPAGQWPDLLTFLHQCSQADSAEHKEVALLLFGRLFETVGGWAQRAGSVCHQLSVSIQQPPLHQAAHEQLQLHCLAPNGDTCSGACSGAGSSVVQRHCCHKHSTGSGSFTSIANQDASMPATVAETPCCWCCRRAPRPAYPQHPVSNRCRHCSPQPARADSSTDSH